MIFFDKTSMGSSFCCFICVLFLICEIEKALHRKRLECEHQNALYWTNAKFHQWLLHIDLQVSISVLNYLTFICLFENAENWKTHDGKGLR